MRRFTPANPDDVLVRRVESAFYGRRAPPSDFHPEIRDIALQAFYAFGNFTIHIAAREAIEPYSEIGARD